MNKMMEKHQTSTSQNHTIISQETIKPSSPTPPHLKIHNLSLLDVFAPDMHIPAVLFYPNYKKGDTNNLKESLSKCLTQYYPFAGRLATPPAPYVNCNDEGVEFLEASNDMPMDYYIHKNKQDKNLDQLFPYGLSSSARTSSPKLLEVQLNYFAGGGVAVATSISHKLADAATCLNLIGHWATITCLGSSPKNPHFISSTKSKNINYMVPKFEVNDVQNNVKYCTGIFVFSNSKLNELKKKVIAMGKVPAKLSRVEVLTALIFKHAVSAAKTKSGSSKHASLSVAMSLRKELVEKNPETAVGNFFTLVISKMGDSGEIRLDEVIAEVKKGKMELIGVRDEEEVLKKLLTTYSNLEGDVYYSSSNSGFPMYDVDFGWGKPVEVTIRMPDVEAKSFMLLDTPSGDGIRALVHLPEEEVAILQNDKEFLSYVENYYKMSRL